MQSGMEMIEAMKAQHGDPDEFHRALIARWPRTHPLLSKKDMPAPLYCDPAVCSTEDPPACTSWEKPVFGGLGIRVVSKDDSLNPYQSRYKPSDKGWGVFIAPGEQLIPREEANHPQCQHRDHCGAIQGNQASGFLTLRLPRMEVGKIIVCCMSGKKCGENFAKVGVQFLFDGKPVPGPYTPIYGKCVVVQEKWSSALSDPDGHLYLGVTVNSSSTLQISQVMTL
jgi:hypothetical protein